MLTFEDANRLWSYNPKTGHLRWKSYMSSRAEAGSIAGSVCKDKNGRPIRINVRHSGKVHKAHRIAWLIYYGELPHMHIDHENQNGCDNRIGNLRLVTPKQNSRNTRRSSKNKSGTLGVVWKERSKKWIVTIGDDGKDINIGSFKFKKDAVEARKSAEIQYGYHPNHGKR